MLARSSNCRVDAAPLMHPDNIHRRAPQSQTKLTLPSLSMSVYLIASMLTVLCEFALTLVARIAMSTLCVDRVHSALRCHHNRRRCGPTVTGAEPQRYRAVGYYRNDTTLTDEAAAFGQIGCFAGRSIESIIQRLPPTIAVAPNPITNAAMTATPSVMGEERSMSMNEVGLVWTVDGVGVETTGVAVAAWVAAAVAVAVVRTINTPAGVATGACVARAA